MKEGWEVKKLGEVCKVERGSSPRPIQKYITTANDSVNWIKIGDTKHVNRYIYKTEEKITKEGALKSRFVDIGDFILSNSMSLGRPYIMKTQGYIHDGWFVLKLNENIDSNYFYYLLTSSNVQTQFHSLSAGAIVKNISSDLVKKALLPIPPLSEQQRIVEILDNAFAKIDTVKQNAERNLRNGKELFQSVLQYEMTPKEGWNKKKLIDIALEFGRGKSKNRPRNDKKLFGGKYPFIQTGDVRNSSKIISSYTQTYNEVGLSQSKLWAKNTICITIAANIAETGILGFDSCFPDSIIGLLVDKEKADLNFTYYLLLFTKEKLQLLGKGSAQDNINLGTFEKLFFFFPSIEIQQQIVTKLDVLSEKCKELENNYQQTINDCDELKKAILAKAFNGEL